MTHRESSGHQGYPPGDGRDSYYAMDQDQNVEYIVHSQSAPSLAMPSQTDEGYSFDSLSDDFHNADEINNEVASVLDGRRSNHYGLNSNDAFDSQGASHNDICASPHAYTYDSDGSLEALQGSDKSSSKQSSGNETEYFEPEQDTAVYGDRRRREPRDPRGTRNNVQREATRPRAGRSTGDRRQSRPDRESGRPDIMESFEEPMSYRLGDRAAPDVHEILGNNFPSSEETIPTHYHPYIADNHLAADGYSPVAAPASEESWSHPSHDQSQSRGYGQDEMDYSYTILPSRSSKKEPSRSSRQNRKR